MSKVLNVDYINRTSNYEHSHDDLANIQLMLDGAENNEFTRHIANMFGFEVKGPEDTMVVG